MSEGLARADALLRPLQAQGTAPPPDIYQPAGWVSYGGGEAILLAIVLLVVAGGFAYVGKRLRAPLKITPPGTTAAAFMIAIWLLAIYTVNVVWLVYGLQLRQAYPDFVAPPLHRVGTFSVHAPVTFLVILYLMRRWGWKVALASAVIGTAAALMIFELPFDLIIMARTSRAIPTHPMLYRQLLYLPLFLAELSTISLLTLLPSMRVTAYAAYAVAGMFFLADADALAACIQEARDDYRSCLDDCVSLAISTTPLHNFGAETLRLLSISSGTFVHNLRNYSCCRQRHWLF